MSGGGEVVGIAGSSRRRTELLRSIFGL